jgi:hypothetical protein
MNRPLADGSKRTGKSVLEVESNKFAHFCNPSFPELTFIRKGSPLGLFKDLFYPFLIVPTRTQFYSTADLQIVSTLRATATFQKLKTQDS